MYESAIKNQLISVLNNNFSPYLAAYRKSYRAKHVLIVLLENGEKIWSIITQWVEC